MTCYCHCGALYGYCDHSRREVTTAVGESIGDKVKRWRELADRNTQSVHTQCIRLSSALLGAANACDWQAARIRELESVQSERTKTMVAQQARISRLEDVLRDIARPDWVVKNDVNWAYQVLNGRIAMARQALGEEQTAYDNYMAASQALGQDE